MGAHHGPDETTATHRPVRRYESASPAPWAAARPSSSPACAAPSTTCPVVVVTNDIFTVEDAAILRRRAVLPDERIVAVQTGCCPHTAIRDDISENVEAIEALERRFAPDVVLVESGGDNLTACFSKALVDVQIFVIDVAGGDKVPRKGGPGIVGSDLLVINKRDLAPFVGADLTVMENDAQAKRSGRPTIVTRCAIEPEAAEIAELVRSRVRSWRPSWPAPTREAHAQVVVDAMAAAPASSSALGPAAHAATDRAQPRCRSSASAASPVGGDQLRLDVVVGPGARLVVCSVAARSPTRHLTVTIDRCRSTSRSATARSLEWRPSPLVLVERCRHVHHSHPAGSRC